MKTRSERQGFDEMQRAKRDHMGNQMFVLLYFLLVANSLLHNFNVKWLEAPADSMVLATACMGVYIVRLIKMDAYLPARVQGTRKPYVTVIPVFIFAFVLAGFLAKMAEPRTPGDSGALDERGESILMMTLAVCWVVSVVILAVKWRQSKKHSAEDEED